MSKCGRGHRMAMQQLDASLVGVAAGLAIFRWPDR